MKNIKDLETKLSTEEVLKKTEQILTNRELLNSLSEKIDYDYYEKETLKFFEDLIINTLIRMSRNKSINKLSFSEIIHFQIIPPTIHQDDYYFKSKELGEVQKKIYSNVPPKTILTTYLIFLLNNHPYSIFFDNPQENPIILGKNELYTFDLVANINGVNRLKNIATDQRILTLIDNILNLKEKFENIQLEKIDYDYYEQETREFLNNLVYITLNKMENNHNKDNYNLEVFWPLRVRPYQYTKIINDTKFNYYSKELYNIQNNFNNPKEPVSEKIILPEYLKELLNSGGIYDLFDSNITKDILGYDFYLISNIETLKRMQTNLEPTKIKTLQRKKSN